jgi:hypothetical protein
VREDPRPPVQLTDGQRVGRLAGPAERDERGPVGLALRARRDEPG